MNTKQKLSVVIMLKTKNRQNTERQKEVRRQKNVVLHLGLRLSFSSLTVGEPVLLRFEVKTPSISGPIDLSSSDTQDGTFAFDLNRF